ncbi:MAG: hypothetical protein KDK12_01625 [Rhodobacteraceae bacterium]|nr:hypothetical protein [Paracoccaceae bacterium]
MGFVFGYALHLFAGVLWAGAVAYNALVLYPSLSRLPAAQAATLLARVGPRAGMIVGTAGALVLLSGPLRAWLGGGIRSASDLTSSYGLIVAGAFILAFVVQGFDGTFRRRLRGLMAEPDAYARQAPALAARNAVAVAGGIALILVLMVLLGTGYY